MCCRNVAVEMLKAGSFGPALVWGQKAAEYASKTDSPRSDQAYTCTYSRSPMAVDGKAKDWGDADWNELGASRFKTKWDERNLYVLAAHETKTIDIPLELGARLPHDVPGLSFELIKVERKDQSLNIHFKYGRPGAGTLFYSGTAPVVLGNELIDADAQPTGHRQSGSSMSGQEGRFNYRLDKDGPEPAFLRLELATGLREQVINFDLRDVPVLPGAPPIPNAQDDGEPAGGHPREAMPEANRRGSIKTTGHDDGTDQ